MSRLGLRSFRILPIFLGLLLASGVSRAERPNVIVILADDLGYGDLGFDLQVDPAEQHDVANQHPEIVERLQRLLDDLAREN